MLLGGFGQENPAERGRLREENFSEGNTEYIAPLGVFWLKEILCSFCVLVFSNARVMDKSNETRQRHEGGRAYGSAAL